MKLVPNIINAAKICIWFDRIDPGVHRRIKGLRLVTAFALAAMLATMPDIAYGRTSLLSVLAACFALWASVSEARGTRYESARDLLLLNFASGIGATLFVMLQPALGPSWSELMLVIGSFCVGYCRRYGILGTGVGSQMFIGQLLAFTTGATFHDLATIALATLLACIASIVPRMLSGPAEQPVRPPIASIATEDDVVFSELMMGAQAAFASLAVAILGHAFGLTQSAWAITACTYVVTNSLAGTMNRVRRRIAGTLVGVPLALLCLPIAAHAPMVIWILAAFALVVYAMALPEHYEIACGAYAFALIATMGVTGEYPTAVLVARGWETILGGVVGIGAVLLFAGLPLALRSSQRRLKYRGIHGRSAKIHSTPGA